MRYDEITRDLPTTSARPFPEEERREELGILSAVGNTPLVRLRKLVPERRLALYGKVEALNPGGSLKDRPALGILRDAMRQGKIGPGTLIVESSSGNMGVGLAQACKYLGLRFVCVVDPNTAERNLQVLRAYGAKVDLVAKPDPATGDFLQARLQRVRAILRDDPGAFWPNPYANQQNPGAHYRTTMKEIASDLGGRVDYLFVATSTCGTLRGCGEYVRDHAMATKIVAVDAEGSLIFRDRPAKRLIPGLGAGIKPPHCDPSLIHEVVHVSNRDCVVGCRQLMDREAILAGGSSGALVTALGRLLPRIEDDAACVLVFCDRGERYLETIFDDTWVREYVGELADPVLS